TPLRDLVGEVLPALARTTTGVGVVDGEVRLNLLERLPAGVVVALRERGARAVDRGCGQLLGLLGVGRADAGGGDHTSGDRDRGHQPDEPMTSMHTRPSLLVLHGCRLHVGGDATEDAWRGSDDRVDER